MCKNTYPKAQNPVKETYDTFRPRQAVIFAGGLGERLRPFTDSAPKPMYPFHGKPFLEYLVERLKEEGIDRITLLLGYLPKVIQDYFGDGERFGVQIDYVISDVSDQTATRLRLAEKKLDPLFLLMYCDNYWPLQLDKMALQFEHSLADAQISVYRNRDGYTRDNVRVDDQGMVTLYDKSRSLSNLKGVEIGYALIRRDQVLKVLPGGNVSFEEGVYPVLAAQGKLAAFQTDHRYYSVGSYNRLQPTETFLRFDPAIILDRDGVLNVRPARAEYVTRWEEFSWLPGALEALGLLTRSGYRIFIMTNQPGIARGMMTEDDLAGVHRLMVKDIERAGSAITGIYHCPHGWNEGCDCRKPAPGMLFQMQREHHLDLTRTPVVGDDERDGEAAAAAGCPFHLVTSDNSLFDVAKNNFAKRDGI